jgi:hypothetical protein
MQARQFLIFRTSLGLSSPPRAYGIRRRDKAGTQPSVFQSTPDKAQRQWQAWQYDCRIFPTTIGKVIKDGHAGKP